MHKNLPLLATVFAVSACVSQAPAPYVQKGDQHQTRSTYSSSYPSSKVQSRPIYEDSYSGNDVEYIDGGNYQNGFHNNNVQSNNLPPLSRNDEVISFGSEPKAKNHVFRSEVITTVRAKPVVDSLPEGAEPKGNLPATGNYLRPTPVLDDAPASTAPSSPKEGYLDLSGVNSLKSGQTQSSQLGSVLPKAKPVLDEKPAVKIEKTIKKYEAPAPTTELAQPVAETAPTEQISIPKIPELVAPPPPAKIAEPVVAKPSEEEQIEKAPIKAADVLTGNSASLLRPVDGKIIGKFGNTPDGTFNDGIKIRAAKGTEVKAADSGEVVYSGNQLQGYGNMIIVRHPNGYLTAYAHLEDLPVKKGAKVGRGEVLGHVGDTGNVDEPQLHFGVREGREPIDPEKFLK